MTTLRSEAQDIRLEACNANMSTPPDGGRDLECKCILVVVRDGDLGQWSHRARVCPRIINKTYRRCAFNIKLLKQCTEQMGEGWSDWYGIMMTQQVGDMGPDARGIGTWLFQTTT